MGVIVKVFRLLQNIWIRVALYVLFRVSQALTCSLHNSHRHECAIPHNTKHKFSIKHINVRYKQTPNKS